MKAATFIIVLIAVLLFACGVPGTPAMPAAPAQPGVQTRDNALPSDWDQLVQGARKEGQIFIYTSLGGSNIRPSLGNAVKEKFGIDAEFVVGKGEEIVARIGNERRGGLYLADVVIIGAPSQINYLKPQGGLDPMKPTLILPEVTDAKNWIGNALPFVDEEARIFAFVAGYRTYITVNTSLVKEGEIKSYKDLLDPKWKGKITLFDPTVGGSGSQWVAGMLMHVYGQEEGTKFLRELAKQQPVITRDGRLQMEWIVHGKYSIAVAPRRENVSDFKAMGAPVDWIQPVEGGEVASGTGATGLVNRAAHPNAARVFLNWLLSKDGQTRFVKAFGSPSARVDVTTEGLDPDTVPVAGRKFSMADEKLYLTMPKAAELAKEIFSAQLR